jgi:hypothetical protein
MSPISPPQKVRAAVRPGPKAEHLHKIFEDYGDRFETVIVEDISKVSFST